MGIIAVSARCVPGCPSWLFSFFTFKDVLLKPAVRLKWLNVACVGVSFIYYLFIYLREAEREQDGGTEGEREKKILQQAPR